MSQEESGSDNFLASALDMLTCGLGATALLFILFSVARVEPEKAAALEQFINARLEVSGEQTPIQLCPVLETPGGARIQLPPDCFNDDTGRLEPTGPQRSQYAADFDALSAASAEENYSLLGFALDRNRAPAVNGKRVFLLRVRKPAPGPWKVSARFFCFAGDAIGSQRERVQVETTVLTRDQRVVVKSEVGYGECSAAAPVTIKP